METETFMIWNNNVKYKINDELYADKVTVPEYLGPAFVEMLVAQKEAGKIASFDMVL